MNKQAVIIYAQNELGLSNTDWVAVVRLRHKAVMLPSIGEDGSLRDESEWAIFDMAQKIDTGEYGAVYYI